ncbi:hypothetical protein RN607_11855 [Demequina capsici]|uniref:Uncharacterized protein n=1 Tax=Demequina capsici TaxID=3075620 RepID=A0AA96FBN1_9MICO|nr:MULTISPECIES: hypothetical protein [unclassified Demequina]WNM24060.1 hypothetical protein RN606_11920 [Demequina sp. OYTSA14]WNM26887.1 hypothetical protein RN607_11855 [Demequina sp. PMTSA13]
MTTLHSAVDAGPTRRGDGLLAWRRPVATALAVAIPATLLGLLHPVASLAVLAPATVVGWRLHGSGIEPWLPHRVDRFPNTVTDPRLKVYARDLRWRWEHAMVVAELGRYDERGIYSGPVLTGVAQHGDGVVARARLLPGQTVRDVDAAGVLLAAGLEAASASVLGGSQGEVSLLVHEREAAEGWT